MISKMCRDLILIWVECDFSMTIEVFKFLNEKMSKLGEEREIVRPNNTGSIGGNKTKSRKRSAEDFILSDHPGNKVHIPNSANQEWFTVNLLSWLFLMSHESCDMIQMIWLEPIPWYFYVSLWQTVSSTPVYSLINSISRFDTVELTGSSVDPWP